MPIYNLGQLIGKTFYIAKPTSFYRLSDIISQGDQAKPVKNKLKVNYSFVLDSYLAPTEENYKFGFKTAKRTDTYFTFFGADGKNYAVKYANDGRFNMKALKEQGVKSEQEIIEEQKKESETAADKLEAGLKSVGLTIRNLLYIGAAIFAVGYILPKIQKK